MKEMILRNTRLESIIPSCKYVIWKMNEVPLQSDSSLKTELEGGRSNSLGFCFGKFDSV